MARWVDGRAHRPIRPHHRLAPEHTHDEPFAGRDHDGCLTSAASTKMCWCSRFAGNVYS